MSVFAKSGSPISAVLTDINGYVVDSTTPIPVNPAESGAVNMATGQQAITASAAQIVAARTTRRAVAIKNADAALILYVGSASVTTANGQKVGAGETIVIPFTGAIYGIGSGSLTSTFIDLYD
jgi:hypothetical protein